MKDNHSAWQLKPPFASDRTWNKVLWSSASTGKPQSDRVVTAKRKAKQVARCIAPIAGPANEFEYPPRCPNETNEGKRYCTRDHDIRNSPEWQAKRKAKLVKPNR